MALSDSDKTTLEEIVATQGQCLDSKRCEKCPFRGICLPEFRIRGGQPTPKQRFDKAMDVLTHHYLIDEDVEVEEIKKDYKWEEK